MLVLLLGSLAGTLALGTLLLGIFLGRARLPLHQLKRVAADIETFHPPDEAGVKILMHNGSLPTAHGFV